MLLAETYPVDAPRADAEWIDERRLNSLGAPLAKLEIVFATASDVCMAYDHKAIPIQRRVVQGIRHEANGAVRLWLDMSGVKVELDGDGQLRKIVELLEQRRSVVRVGA